MGSTLSFETCPICGGPHCCSEYYYKSQETYLQCRDCGYYKSIEIKEESKNKKFDEMTENDWETYELDKPYGAYRGKSKNSKAFVGGSISSKKHLDDIINNLTDDIDEFTVSRFINEKIVVIDMLRKIKLEQIKKKNKP